MIKTIYTKEAPEALGPYSQAVKAGNMLFTSGQIPIDPKTGQAITDDIKMATDQVMKNLGAILNEAGYGWKDVAKTTIFLADMDDFGDVNEVYGTYFTDHKPARSCVEVAKLPKGMIVEIECIAMK